MAYLSSQSKWGIVVICFVLLVVLGLIVQFMAVSARRKRDATYAAEVSQWLATGSYPAAVTHRTVSGTWTERDAERMQGAGYQVQQRELFVSGRPGVAREEVITWVRASSLPGASSTSA